MSQPGIAPDPPEAPGAAKYRALMSGGFSQQEADDYKAQQSIALAKGGFNRDEIDSYWGDKKTAPALSKVVQQNTSSPHEASNLYEEALGGWQESVSGLASSGKPTLAHSDKNGIAGDVVHSAAQFVGDLPAAVPGGFMGGGVGTALGAAVPGLGETGTSETVGGAAGFGFGFNAVPQAVRESLLAAYNRGEVKTWGDAWNVAYGAAKRTVTTGMVGAVTNLVGAPAANITGKIGGGVGTQTAVRLGTEAATATTMGAVLDGHVPDAHDFAAAGLLVAGLHMTGGAAFAAGRFVKGKYVPSETETRISSNLQNVYRETGVPPWEAAKLAKTDPVVYQELLAQDSSGNPTLTKTRIHAGIEPKAWPTKTNAPEGEETKALAFAKTAEDLLPTVKGLEGSGDQTKDDRAISPAGAMGRYQIMPGTARQYGFDPAHLLDPEYNETVAKHVLNDLIRRYNGDTAAVLVAYNAGPGRAAKFLAAGRDPSVLPEETQHYLQHAESMGLTPVGPYRANWSNFRDRPEMVLRQFSNGQVVPDSGAISDYLKEFGRLANFNFKIEPSMTEGEQAAGEREGPAFHSMPSDPLASAHRNVFIPDTPDELSKRWYGLGRYEVLYHEVGHAIDSYFHGGTGMTRQISDPDLKAEMTQSSKAWKPLIWERYPDHAKKPAEIIADNIARYISDPSVRKEMPLFAKYYADKLQPYIEAAEKSLPTRQAGGDWKDPEGSAGGGGWYGIGGGNGGKPPGGGDSPPQPRIEGPKGDRFRLPFNLRATRFQEDMIGAQGDRKLPGINDAIRQYVSELKPAEDIDKILREQGRLGPKDMGVADMFRQTYGSEGRAISFLKDGPLDLSDPSNIKRVEGVKSYMQVLADVRKGGGSLEGFDYWRSAQRTVQLSKRGIEGVMPLDEAQATLKDAPKIYAQADKDLQAFQSSVLDYAVSSGTISAKQKALMLKAGPSYVSFRRIMGDDKSFIGMRGSRSFRVGRSVFKIEGSDKQIISPLMSDIDNTRLLVRMADRNRAVNSAVGSLAPEKTGLPAMFEEVKPIEIAEPGSDVFKPYGLDEDTERAFMNMTAVKAESGDKNTFTRFVNGKPILMKAKTEELAQLMRGADSTQEAHIIDRVMTTASKLTRLGVVLSPDFPIRVGLRHETTAYVYDPLHPPPIVNFVSGMMDMFGKKDAFHAWQANGGAGATFAEMGEHHMKADIYRLFDETGFTNKAWNVVRHPIQAGLALQEFISTANRVGYYKRALGMGLDPLKAATRSRTAYLDYSERGTSAFVNTWSKWTPFLRAHLLGTEMLVKAYANDPVGTVARLALSHIVPSVILYALNYLQDQSGQIPENQQYKNIPRWEKDTYFILPQVGGTRLRIPYAFQSGALGGGLVQRFLDSEYKKDPHAFDDWARSLVNEFVPPVIPDVARPPLEIASNSNFFSGKPLIPDSMKDASGQYQFTDGTSEAAKALSKFVSPLANISPIHIDEVVRGYAGTLGQDALKAVDAVSGHPGMPWEVADIPFVQSFVVRNRGSEPQVIEDFYNDLHGLEQKNADFGLARKRGDFRAMLASANGRAYYQLDQASHALGVMHDLIRGVEQNTTMSTDEKRQSIDSVYAQMIAISKVGSQAIRSMQ